MQCIVARIGDLADMCEKRTTDREVLKMSVWVKLNDLNANTFSYTKFTEGTWIEVTSSARAAGVSLG